MDVTSVAESLPTFIFTRLISRTHLRLKVRFSHSSSMSFHILLPANEISTTATSKRPSEEPFPAALCQKLDENQLKNSRLNSIGKTNRRSD